MATKKHLPKHRRQRKKLHRKWCPYCDGHGVIAEVRPSFGMYAEGQNLPFKTAIAVSGLAAGMIRIVFTFPERDYFVPEFHAPDFDDYSQVNMFLRGYEVKQIERQKQQFATLVRYCPKCGRDFKDKTARTWIR